METAWPSETSPQLALCLRAIFFLGIGASRLVWSSGSFGESIVKRARLLPKSI